jgi:hypothetical protein
MGLKMNPDSSVGVVTRHWAKRPRNLGSIPDKEKNISPLQSVQIGSCVQRIPGDYSPGVKQPGCQADLSFTSTVKVKNSWG